VNVSYTTANICGEKTVKLLYKWNYKVIQFILFMTVRTLLLILTKFMRTYSTVQR